MARRERRHEAGTRQILDDLLDGDREQDLRFEDLLAGLDPDVFWQVHRGSVVRVSTIARVRRDELGRSRIELRGHRETLPVSAAFVHRFRGM